MLPIRATPTDPGKPVRLVAKVDYAVCEKVCLPAKASAEIELGERRGLALRGGAWRRPARRRRRRSPQRNSASKSSARGREILAALPEASAARSVRRGARGVLDRTETRGRRTLLRARAATSAGRRKAADSFGAHSGDRLRRVRDTSRAALIGAPTPRRRPRRRGRRRSTLRNNSGRAAPRRARARTLGEFGLLLGSDALRDAPALTTAVQGESLRPVFLVVDPFEPDPGRREAPFAARADRADAREQQLEIGQPKMLVGPRGAKIRAERPDRSPKRRGRGSR